MTARPATKAGKSPQRSTFSGPKSPQFAPVIPSTSSRNGYFEVSERRLEHIRASTKIFADETTSPVLDPGRGRTFTPQEFMNYFSASGEDAV
jgi:hypothetical protein